VVFFFVIRFRQNRLKRDLVLEKEKSTDLSIKMAEQQIENKKLELSKILTNIDKSSSLSEEVLARLSILKQKDGDVKDDISQLIQFINSMSRTNSINELVEKNSDVLGFGLKERIEKRFPNLTPSELQLIILIRIGLSTKEVAQLKNVEPTSVRIFKHRLKVKLEVPKELDLNRFVSEL
jgi:DNA-binding NarL/FixJ family response regulator